MKNTPTKKPIPFITIAIIVIVLAILGYSAYILSQTDTSSVGKVQENYNTGTTTKYNLNHKNFTLTHPKEVYPMPKDSAKWGPGMENNEITGVMMWYFVNGEERMLTNPYIRVSYVSKKGAGCSTIDSLYIWLDNMILKTQESKVIRNRFTIPIPSDKMLVCKEYSWGERKMSKEQTSIIDSKFVAYAYMDYDKDYWLGFALTTKERDKFDNYLPSFYYIVKSFK